LAFWIGLENEENIFTCFLAICLYCNFIISKRCRR
jgi:hypothetical protein